ncbi:hypothetical protein RIF23_15045 [Lipingzhangella sp. LS1_29]|uniref:Uncharacterized protein n=1 Tax=Lipingzhangella rawalii TaxID=2055835 RepID=A0ABU2H9U3_9ACTN|nr:hypothetical protein [Lipingzhangella rawalii]MDS1271610.1 hypothetical protein [Lipingzhangella rawalii]
MAYTAGDEPMSSESTVRVPLEAHRGSGRDAAVLTESGLELVRAASAVRSAAHLRVHWEDIQVVSTWQRVYRERCGDSFVYRTRPVLDLYLHREPEPVLIDWVDSTHRPDPELDGVSAPAHRLRIGGEGAQLEAFVRGLATALGEARPELFYTGIRAEQWFCPEHAGPVPYAEPAARRAPTADETPAGVARVRYHRWIGIVLLPVWAAGTGIASLALWGPGGTVDNGRVWSAVLWSTALLVFGGMLGWGLWSAPRWLARIEVRVDEHGLGFVQKRRWRLPARRQRTTVLWSEVQAVVARIAPDVGQRRLGDTVHVLDIYLHPQPAEAGDDRPAAEQLRDGVGLELSSRVCAAADTPGLAALVAFPATCLRLPYEPWIEQERAHEWRRAHEQSRLPRPLRPAHLRRVLRSYRGDLCYGFTDLTA